MPNVANSRRSPRERYRHDPETDTICAHWTKVFINDGHVVCFAVWSRHASCNAPHVSVNYSLVFVVILYIWMVILTSIATRVSFEPKRIDTLSP